MTGRVRVLLVDDHPVVLSGLAALFANHADLQVVGAVGDGAEAERCLTDAAPDVAVVDLRLPDTDGAQLCRRLLLARPALRVMVLTMHSDDELVLGALAAGASGYVLKDADPGDLVDAVRQVARGHLVVGAGARPALAAPLAEPAPPRIADLSPREVQVLDLLAQGLATAAIAQRLDLAPKTVRNRLSTVFAKLGVADRVAAVALARDAGLGRLGASRQGRPRP